MINTQYETQLCRIFDELGEYITFEEKFDMVTRQIDNGCVTLIGTGATSHVFRVSDSVGTVALKAIQDVDMYKREFDALRLLSHPHIISLKGRSTISQYHCLWLEHIPHESLYEYIRTVPEGSVEESEAMYIFCQLACAVAYMHNRKISHHDLNSRNILIDDNTKRVKIIDFGLSVFVPDGGMVDHNYGTPLYLPLEVLEGQIHDPLAVDVWSLGIILVEILLQYHPFKMAKSMVDLAKLIINRRISYPRAISRGTLSLIDLTLTIDPSKRITIHKVLEILM
jgi:serine/threonine protein kinase